MTTDVFQIKQKADLEASLLNYVLGSAVEVNDMNVGSVVRSILGAVAQEAEEIYYRQWSATKQAILQGILTSFNFSPVQGTVAGGTVTFGRETQAPADYLVPEGTELISAGGLKYKTTVDVTLLTNTSSIDAPVISETTGSDANINTVGTPLQILNPIPGVSTATTSSMISGGTDTESQIDLMNRFSAYIDALSRSTRGAIEYAALSANLTDGSGNITEQVKAAVVRDYQDDVTIPRGEVVVYVDNGVGAPSGQNMVLNGDFESGFTNWTAQSATVDSTVAHFGGQSSKLVAAGSSVSGAKSDPIVVNTAKAYNLSLWNYIPVYSAGKYKTRINFYSDTPGTTLISSIDLVTFQGITTDWVITSTTIGPGQSMLFPATTASVRIEQYWDTTPTGTAYMDTVMLYDQSLLIAQVKKIVDGYEANGVDYDGYKADGVIATILPVNAVKINVSVAISSDYFSTTQPYVEDAITRFFANLNIGDNVDYNLLISAIITCSEYVKDAESLSLVVVGGSTYTDDVPITGTQRAIINTLSVTAV